MQSSPELLTTEHIRSNMFMTSIPAHVGLPSLKSLPAPVACLTACFTTTDRCIWPTKYEVCVEPLGSRYGFEAKYSKWYFVVSPLWATCRACRCAMQRMTTPCAVSAQATAGARGQLIWRICLCAHSQLFIRVQVYLSLYKVFLHRTVKKKTSFGFKLSETNNQVSCGAHPTATTCTWPC
jgi:hypothetical protein